MRNPTIAIIAMLFLFDVTAHLVGVQAQDATPSATALLRGVEQARTRHTSVRTELTIIGEGYVPIIPDPDREATGKMEYLIEFENSAGGVRGRFELGGNRGREILVRNHDELYSYEPKDGIDSVPGNSLLIHDINEPWGTIAGGFDPRVLGLSYGLRRLTVQDCLWTDKSDTLKVVGAEMIDGRDVWRVKATLGETILEYWIEEPSFRVYRVTAESLYQFDEITSEFAGSDDPFPRRVVAKSTSKRNGRTETDTYIVKSWELDVKIPEERFTMASIDPPVNTPVGDSRIQRRLGYWNGTGLQDDPVNFATIPVPDTGPEVTPEQRRSPWLFIVINLAVVLVLLGVIAWRWRVSTA